MKNLINRVKYRYVSLEDFLISNPLSVDGQLDDGWGVLFPVKGREIHVAILFADISSFSKRTLELSPTETLIFLNNFFTWISAEALRNRPGIVDKYIGDEIMVIFSDEFGSEDSFVDALQTARWMAENDFHDFCPRMGIAAGVVTVGFVGTPLKYSCSVFGVPVVLAKRCATTEPLESDSCSIIFPAELWEDRSFEEIFPPRKYTGSNGKIREESPSWKLLPPRRVPMKNIPEIEIIEVAQTVIHIPQQPAEERAKEGLQKLKTIGMYKPRKVKEE
jgi:class 3 adenylate cyclase